MHYCHIQQWHRRLKMIEKTERYVERALRERPKTRDDDNLLYLDVLHK